MYPNLFKKISKQFEIMNKYMITLTRFVIGLIFLVTLIFGVLTKNNIIIIPYIHYIVSGLGIVLIIGLVLFSLFSELSKIFKALSYYTTKDKYIIETSIHEAGHALVRELLLKKSNKASITKRSIFSCYKFVKEEKNVIQATGVNISDETWSKIYTESLDKNKLDCIYYNILIALAGEIAEKIAFDNSSIFQMDLENENLFEPGSDLHYVSKLLAVISNATRLKTSDLANKAIIDCTNILEENKNALIDIYSELQRVGYINGKNITKLVKRSCSDASKYSAKYNKFIYIKNKVYSILSKEQSIKCFIDILVDAFFEFKHLLNSVLKEFKSVSDNTKNSI